MPLQPSHDSGESGTAALIIVALAGGFFAGNTAAETNQVIGAISVAMLALGALRIIRR
ncbi:hypothetical protein ACGFZG_25685 [Streptomyces antibioticus]|uniref:hypothetical protein n=1 Tax=Streptomyces antibioticus TaxID=1890 RepID=UPI00371570D1